MVGSSAAAFAKAKPAFECMGRNIVHVGDSGAGQVTKASNQIVTGTGVLAVAEAFAFAAKNGVDREKVREALLASLSAMICATAAPWVGRCCSVRCSGWSGARAQVPCWPLR